MFFFSLLFLFFLIYSVIPLSQFSSSCDSWRLRRFVFGYNVPVRRPSVGFFPRRRSHVSAAVVRVNTIDSRLLHLSADSCEGLLCCFGTALNATTIAHVQTALPFMRSNRLICPFLLPRQPRAAFVHFPKEQADRALSRGMCLQVCPLTR